MKYNYKTTSTILLVNRETNLMRSLTAWLENGQCSITVANDQLITVIRFITKSYTHQWKDFANRLHLVLHACEILFSRNVCENNQTFGNSPNPRTIRHWIFEVPTKQIHLFHQKKFRDRRAVTHKKEIKGEIYTYNCIFYYPYRSEFIHQLCKMHVWKAQEDFWYQTPASIKKL